MNTCKRCAGNVNPAPATLLTAMLGALWLCATSTATVAGEPHSGKSPKKANPVVAAMGLMKEGQKTFRFDTFGDEAFWGDALRLHESIAGAANGGVGPGLAPSNALGLGLKVDVTALPARIRQQLRR